MFAYHVVSLVLKLCGDIESNLGPTTEELLQLILDKDTQIEGRLTDIESKLESFHDQCIKLVRLENTVRDLERTVQLQQQKLNDMEDRARRNNIIVFGVLEDAKETRSDIETKVLKNIYPNSWASL